MPQFCLFPSLDLSKAREYGPHFQKAWSRFNADGFLSDLHQIDWESIFQRYDFDADNCFNIFNEKIKVLVDQHLPTVKLTKRQLKLKLKPWITPGLLKSIAKRDVFYRKFIKAKSPEIKTRFSNYISLIETKLLIYVGKANPIISLAILIEMLNICTKYGLA